MARQRGYRLVIAAFAMALAGVAILALAPLTTVVTERDSANMSQTDEANEEEWSRENLVATDGWGAVARIALAVAVVGGLPLLAPSGRPALVTRAASSLLLFSGVVVGIFSIGIFLAPAALLMLIATVLAQDGQHSSDVSAGI